MEDWIGGVELDPRGVIYGIRRYTKGARLLTHVDHINTHAVAMIINVDQSVHMPEPWKLEIYDFDNRLHEITMEPGDVVFYEAAKCLHGRMSPLRGDFYSNLFAHFYPKGDLDWASHPGDYCSSPLGRTACAVGEEDGDTTIDAKERNTLSIRYSDSEGRDTGMCNAAGDTCVGDEVVSSPDDLYERWRRLSSR
ncbi:unnamed protein product [Symbiodinium microadriaticum]|nr:unnamed protein product [Symbiodinium microadriaticum]